MSIIFKLVLFAWLFPISKSSIPAKWNTLYSLQTSNQKDVSTLLYTVNSNTPVFRVTLECNDSSVDNLLLVALRQRNSIIGLHVPRIIDNYEFDRVSRTLYPLDHIVGTEPFTIEVSSYKALKYTVRADLVTDFEIKTNETRLVSASASQPVFYHYRFPEHIDTVLVNMESNSRTCMTVSIQKAECLVFDLQSNVRYEGLYATMTTHGSVRVSKSSFREFFIVLVINQNDDLCEDWYNIKHMKPIALPVLEKTFNLTVREEKFATGYVSRILFDTIFMLVLGLIGCIFIFFGHNIKSCLENCLRRFWGYQNLEGGREAEAIGAGEAAQAIGADEAVPEVQAIGADGAAQAIGADGADPEAQAIGAGRAELFQQLKRLMQVVAGYFDRDTLTLENQWEQLNPNQNIQPNGAPIVPPNIHDVYDYIVGILFLSIYYCFFATIQMLIREARSNKDSGSFDNCVYNFNCAHSWSIFVSANSVVFFTDIFIRRRGKGKATS